MIQRSCGRKRRAAGQLTMGAEEWELREMQGPIEGYQDGADCSVMGAEI